MPAWYTLPLSFLQAAPEIVEAASDINAEVTVLAPNNGAFTDLSAEELAALIANTGELTEVLQRHVIEGAVKAADLSDGQTVTTLGGEELTVSVAGDTITFTAAEGGTVATVVTADLMSCKGVVHIISEVLIPGDEPELGGGDEPASETPVEETPAGETPVEETPAGEEPVEETPAGEEPVEETPAGETPVEETPAGETPVEETPAGEEPVEETPAGETPVEETPAGETPVEETPVEETPVEETPAGETPVEETPGACTSPLELIASEPSLSTLAGAAAVWLCSTGACIHESLLRHPSKLPVAFAAPRRRNQHMQPITTGSPGPSPRRHHVIILSISTQTPCHHRCPSQHRRKNRPHRMH